MTDGLFFFGECDEINSVALSVKRRLAPVFSAARASAFEQSMPAVPKWKACMSMKLNTGTKASNTNSTAPRTTL